jgi:N-acetylmuramoyl-L-alanine amidase
MSLVCISAGHNPSKQGAEYKGLTEYTEATGWAVLLTSMLSEDISVDYVPTGELSDKVDFINSADPALAIEIHFNSAMSGGEHVGRGSETLYMPGSVNGKAAAKIMQANLSGLFAPDRGIKEGWYQMDPEKGADYFLRKTRCTALIVEPEFIHRTNIIQTNRKNGCEALRTAILTILGESE